MQVEKRTDFPMDGNKYAFPVGSLVWVPNKKQPILIGSGLNYNSSFGIALVAPYSDDYICAKPLAWNPFMSELYNEVTKSAIEEADESSLPFSGDIYQNRWNSKEFVFIMAKYYNWSTNQEMVRYNHNIQGNGNMPYTRFLSHYISTRYNKVGTNGKLKYLSYAEQNIFGVTWIPEGYEI